METTFYISETRHEDTNVVRRVVCTHEDHHSGATQTNALGIGFRSAGVDVTLGERGTWGRTPGGYFYGSARFSSAEHGGTHIDSPLHFAEGQPSVDQLTMRQLIGPAIVIDVSEACAKDADYLVSPADLSNWEKKHGRIPSGSIVLIRTGVERALAGQEAIYGDR